MVTIDDLLTILLSKFLGFDPGAFGADRLSFCGDILFRKKDKPLRGKNHGETSAQRYG
jgi:hypothetical protein